MRRCYLSAQSVDLSCWWLFCSPVCTPNCEQPETEPENSTFSLSLVSPTANTCLYFHWQPTFWAPSDCRLANIQGDFYRLLLFARSWLVCGRRLSPLPVLAILLLLVVVGVLATCNWSPTWRLVVSQLSSRRFSRVQRKSFPFFFALSVVQVALIAER